MKKILVLGAGILQISTIKKARELGYFTIALDGNEFADGFVFCDKSYIVDITNPDKVLEIALNENIDGIIHPCSEVAMLSLGYVNDIMKLNGLGVEKVIRATNKAKMRKAFDSGGASSPMSIMVETANDAMLAFKKINGNAIFKPSRNSGSRGVSFVGNLSQTDEIVKAFEHAFKQSKDASVVVEQYIEGPEFSVELLIWNNNILPITVTDKLTTNAPHFVELGHSQPSMYSDFDVTAITNAAIKGIQALDLNNCVAHAELKLAKDGPYIMEIGARLGGDFISTELVHLSTGIDMVACAIDIALGLEPDLTPKSIPMGAAIRYLTSDPGIVEDIICDKSKISADTIYDFQLYIQRGSIINPLNSSLDRCGHVITTGITVKDAIIKAENVLEGICVKIY